MPWQFLFLLPTTDCRSRCAHCFYETGHTPRVAAVDYVAALERALGSLAELTQVILTGGEPLASPRLGALAELFAGRAEHRLLVTRGDGLDGAMLESLERWGFDDVTLSIDAADDAARRLVQRVMFHSRYVPNLLTCLTRANAAAVPELLELSERRGLPHLFTPAYIPRGAPDWERLSLHRLDRAGWERLIGALTPWAEAAGAWTYLELVRDFYLGRPVRVTFCPMGTHGFVVDADGTVFPCFHRRDLRAGNLTTEPWPAIEGRLRRDGTPLRLAPCFGEHCLSLFTWLRARRPEAGEAA